MVAKPAAAVAAKQAGAQIVIPKPVLPGHTKYALLTSDVFMGRMRAGHPLWQFKMCRRRRGRSRAGCAASTDSGAAEKIMDARATADF